MESGSNIKCTIWPRVSFQFSFILEPSPDKCNGNPVKESSSFFDQTRCIEDIHKPREKTQEVLLLTSHNFCDDHLTPCIATRKSIFWGVHIAQTDKYWTQLLNCSSLLETSLNNVKNILPMVYQNLATYLFWVWTKKLLPGPQILNQL